MDLYLVSKSSQEKTNTGTIEMAYITVYGIYTTSSRANSIANKYGAIVTELVADKENLKVVSKWINPGYIKD